MRVRAVTPLATQIQQFDPLAEFEENALFAIWRGRPISRGTFHSHVRQLSGRLPEARYALNLCEDKYLFAVCFVALLIRDQTNLLPPNLTEQVLREILVNYSSSYCIHDQPGTAYPGRNFNVSGNFDNTATAETFSICPDRIAAINFTSGSTGPPKAFAKTWRVFCDCAGLALRQLRLGDKSLSVVSTVPSQHMYGLETSLFWPLNSKLSLYSGRPFFPEDVRRAIALSAQSCLLVSTPLHLKACVDASINWKNLFAVISSTAPLDRDLAIRIEKSFQAPLYEIFGSTETLSFASRQRTMNRFWTPYPDVTLLPRGGTQILETGYFPQPIALDDMLEIQSDGKFRVIGRLSDMVKIAGKRTSLSELNQRLNQIDGIEDGVFFFPDDRSELKRLAALVVAKLPRPVILDQLRRSIDEVFLPRPIYFTDRIPRNSIGKVDRATFSEMLKDLSHEQRV